MRIYRNEKNRKGPVELTVPQPQRTEESGYPEGPESTPFQNLAQHLVVAIRLACSGSSDRLSFMTLHIPAIYVEKRLVAQLGSRSARICGTSFTCLIYPSSTISPCSFRQLITFSIKT
jgi:hypothetical protein